MTLFVPASQLIVKGGKTQNADKLVLVSGDWFQMQNAVQAILSLPSDMKEYTLRYGEASSGSEMGDCFNAMRDLREVGAKYGNPKQLRAKILKDPNFLASAERPEKDPYSLLIWAVTRAHEDAFALASYLKSIPENARGSSPADVVAGIKTIFTDRNGIADKMHATAMAFDVLVKELQKLENELGDFQKAMSAYTDRSSNTRVVLDKEIGDLKAKIARWEKDREAAYDKWLDLTISSVAVSAGIALLGAALSILLVAPSGGTSLAWGTAITIGAATAAGTALSVAAVLARSSYEDIVKTLEGKGEFLVKRTTYRNDLGALDSLMKFSLPASGGLIKEVRGFRDGWNSTLGEIRSRISDLSVDNLQSGPWLKPDEMAAAAANWTKLDTLLKSFTVGSFVDYAVLQFGEPLPSDDPTWQKDFVKKFAA